MNYKSERNQTVLIYRTGCIGDLIVIFPAVQLLRRLRPECRIVMMTDSSANSSAEKDVLNLLRSSGLVSEFVNYVPLRKQFSLGNIVNHLKTIKQIRLLKPEGVICFSQDRQRPKELRKLLLFFGSGCGIKRRIGFRITGTPDKDKNGFFQPVKNEYRRHLETSAEYLNTKTPDKETISFKFPEQTSRKVSEYINLLDDFIAVVPGSKMPVKRWPAECYKSVLKRIADKYPDMSFIFLGSADEKALSEDILSPLPSGRAVNLSGSLSLSESAVVLQKSVFYFGNDTGAMHLASVLGVKCFALFSSRDYPGRWDPYGPDHTVFRSAVECEGCFLEECKVYGNKCLKNTDSETVFLKIDLYLGNQQSARMNQK